MKKLFVILVTLSFVQSAQATIIDNGSYTTDTDTGLNWLDITASVNRSYNDVSSQFGAGGDFEGWRYATGDEFNALVSHWVGIVPEITDYGLQEYPTVAALDGLSRYLNITLFDREGFQTIGLVQDMYDADSQYLAYLRSFRDPISPDGPDLSHAHYNFTDPTFASVAFGSFLVRATNAPEPASLALMSLGLLGLVLAGRKR